MLLKDYLFAEKIKVYQLASAINVSQPTVTQWKNGDAIPTMKNMKKLITFTNGYVLPNDFFKDFIESQGFNREKAE